MHEHRHVGGDRVTGFARGNPHTTHVQAAARWRHKRSVTGRDIGCSEHG